jgi:hypothetical protein
MGRERHGIFKELNMFHTILNAVLGSRIRNTVIAAGALACMAAPQSALAHHHGFHVDVLLPAPAVVVASPAVIVPGSDCQTTQIWVEPVYRTVTDRVWVAPVTTTAVQRMAVPAQYGWSNVVVYDAFGRGHIRPQRVEISPAHYEDQAVQVVVTPGHFEEQTHQELVSPGHYQTQVVQTPVVVQPVPARVEIPLPF